MKFLERWAERYLEKRGRYILPRLFVGMIIGGHATAVKLNGIEGWDRYEVMLPAIGKRIAVCNSVFLDATHRSEK